MNAKPIPQVTDPTTARAFDAVKDTLGQLIGGALVDAVVLAPVTIAATDTRILHGLGRLPRGYFIVKAPVTGLTVADGATAETADPTRYIRLRLSTAALVTLVVF